MPEYHFTKILPLLGLALSPLGVLAAEEADKAQPTPIPYLGAPLVTKLDWNIGSLTVADVNGDGKKDIVILNNDTGRIEILYQRQPGEPVIEKKSPRRDRWTPVLEDASFRRESIPGDAAMIALDVGDLNGDGLADIAFTSERNGLNVIYQGPKVEWSEPIRDKRYSPAVRSNALCIADIDGKGKSAIVELTKQGIAVYRFDGANTEALPEPQLYRTDGTDGNLILVDILGNGRPALATFNAGEESTLRLRLAQGDGSGYGPEITVTVPATSMALRAPLAAGPKFVAVNARQRRVSAATFVNDSRPLDGADNASSRTYSPENGIGGAGQTAIFDVDGDKVDDLVIVDAKAAQLLVYKGRADGDFQEAITYPSLSGISEIAKISGPKGEPALLVLSEKEGILGAVHYDNGKPSFPEPISVNGKPLHIATYNEGKIALDIVLAKDDAGKTAIYKIITDVVSGQNWRAGDFKSEKLFDVDASRRDVVALQLADINGDGLPEILAFMDRESMRIWAQDKEGKYAEVAKESAYRKTMLDSVTPADIGWGIVDDTKKPALLVAAQGYIRALRLDEKGELDVVFQANSRRSGDKLRCPMVGNFSGKGIVLLAYNETDKSLEWMERDDAGVFRTKQLISMDGFSPFEAWQQSVATEKTPRLLYSTKNRIVQIPTARRGLRVELKSIYETDLEGFAPMVATTGSFDTTDKKSIILIDPRKHIMEMIQSDNDDQWRSALHFTLFDENPHYRGRRSPLQPRETQVGDVTGDGLDDLILLMHDRILVYPQQRK
ncbi:MAG: VCBS repeat-containing protein [Puniceicoccales bacterium]|jgi:hypothetical protein|nr:VCBS repeat-containing protein [Puniceicoccales bacterium]